TAILKTGYLCSMIDEAILPSIPVIQSSNPEQRYLNQSGIFFPVRTVAAKICLLNMSFWLTF
ncbi:MAG: hypothetical protein DRP51_07675, partial [Candidatus Zixiibacteriota bacterium]